MCVVDGSAENGVYGGNIDGICVAGMMEGTGDDIPASVSGKGVMESVFVLE